MYRCNRWLWKEMNAFDAKKRSRYFLHSGALPVADELYRYKKCRCISGLIGFEGL